MLWPGAARACSEVLVLGRIKVDQGCSMPGRQILASVNLEVQGSYDTYCTLVGWCSSGLHTEASPCARS